MTTTLPTGQILYRAEIEPMQPNSPYSFSDKFEGALTYLTYKVPTRGGAGTVGIYMVKAPIIVPRNYGTYAYRRESDQGIYTHYYDYYYTLTSDDVTKLGDAYINMGALYDGIMKMEPGFMGFRIK